MGVNRYHSERTGTDYENQSATVFIIPYHGSEVLNSRDQRVFFFPSKWLGILQLDHAKGKKTLWHPHLLEAHGDKNLLYEGQFRVLKKCHGKFDCLVYEMLFIQELKPSLNTQSDFISAKLFV